MESPRLKNRYLCIDDRKIKKRNESASWPTGNFFKKRLRALRQSQTNTLSLHIIPFINDQPVGWGHFSVFADNKQRAELFVFILKDYRHKGIGTHAINILLDHKPDDVKEITIPSLIDMSPYLRKNFNTSLESSEKRGLLRKSEFLFKSSNIKVYTIDEMAQEVDLVRYIINYNELNISVSKYINRMKSSFDVFGKKQCFAFLKEDNIINGYAHISYNFEENSEVAFIESDWNNKLSLNQEKSLYQALLNVLFKETDVTYVLTFDFDEKRDLLQSLGFRYINTLDNHLMRV